MDYERKYKEALKKAKESYHRFEGKIVHYDLVKLDLEDMFFELKESEDERIRKEIIRVFKGEISFTSQKENEKYIAWLEKQGEQKLIDKVEPKFKVGDFLVNDYCMGKVIELTNDAYLLDTGQGIPFSCEHNVHLWTIQDAKDGDVLAANLELECEYIISPFIAIYKEHGLDFFNSYCFIGHDGKFYKGDTGHNIEGIHPATKEQRDLLFKKMHDAGYEWNADKKELKKIHVIDEGKAEMDYCFTKMMKGEKVTPAWSEEDKTEFNHVIKVLKSVAEEQETKGYNNLIGSVNWLKSLKDRYTWKPSDEQMKQLGWIAEQNKDNMIGKELMTLYNDLKKLKG